MADQSAQRSALPDCPPDAQAFKLYCTLHSLALSASLCTPVSRLHCPWLCCLWSLLRCSLCLPKEALQVLLQHHMQHRPLDDALAGQLSPQGAVIVQQLVLLLVRWTVRFLQQHAQGCLWRVHVGSERVQLCSLAWSRRQVLC